MSPSGPMYELCQDYTDETNLKYSLLKLSSRHKNMTIYRYCSLMIHFAADDRAGF